MFATILRGRVTQQDWITLQQRYEDLFKHVPDGLLHCYLLQDNVDRNHWEIISFWKSEDAFMEAKQAGKTAACENLLCEGATVPERTCFHIRRTYQRI